MCRRNGKDVCITVDVNVNCDNIWDLLSVYADGEATTAESDRVESHIAECADCARDLEFMRRAAFSLGETPEAMPPGYLRQAILDATVNKPRWSERAGIAIRRALGGQRTWQIGLAGAGALAALLLFYPRQPESPFSRLTADNKVAFNSGPAFRKNESAKTAEPKVSPKTNENRPAVVAPVDPGFDEDALVTEPVKSNRLVVAHNPGHVFTPVFKPRIFATHTLGAKKEPSGGPQLNPDALEMPADMEEMMGMPKTMDVAKSTIVDPPKDGEAGPADPSLKPVATVKIILASSSQNLDPGVVASLAGLRKDLAKQRSSILGSTAIRASQRGQLTIGLIRTSF